MPDKYSYGKLPQLLAGVYAINTHNMTKHRFILFLQALVLTAFLGCGKSSGGNDPEPAQGFDKSAMLANYADVLIIPGYALLQTNMNAFQTASDNFLAAPTPATQQAALAAYKELHLQYAAMAPFQLGPAETVVLDNFINFTGGLDYNFNTAGQLTGFSVDSTGIEQNITSGTYNLGSLLRATFYQQGFPAVGYLYFGPNAISKFGVNNAARVKYAKEVVTRMKTLMDKVVADWPGYRAAFVANTKTNVGSPIGSIVNQMAYQLDVMKGPRIGWPFGKQSNGIVFATKCEAYFGGFSVAAAVQNMTALKKVYTGNGNGKGISDYLVSLKRAQLNTDILAQFDLVIQKLSLIPDPLSAALTTQAGLVENAYKETQKLLTLLKTDLASATAVQISYMDNDGD